MTGNHRFEHPWPKCAVIWDLPVSGSSPSSVHLCKEKAAHENGGKGLQASPNLSVQLQSLLCLFNKQISGPHSELWNFGL